MNVLLAMTGAVSQGILWGIMTVGVYLTYRVLDYADLSVEGSFALGGIMSAAFILKDLNPFLTLIFSMLAGAFAGVATGLLHTKLKIPPILSGILCMIALYSVNMRITGQSNIPLIKMPTVVSIICEILPFSKVANTIILGAAFCAAIIAILYWFFGTEVGCAIRATGCNDKMSRALGANTDWMKIICLSISNALVALSGALVSQQQGYADVGMGVGAIVIGLASVIIGEVLFGTRHSFGFKLASVVIGSVIYRVIVAVVLQLGLRTTDLKLFTAIIVAAALALPTIKQKFAVAAR